MGGREVGNTCWVIDMGLGFEACAAWACIAGIHFFRRRGAFVASFSHEFTFLVQMEITFKYQVKTPFLELCYSQAGQV